MPKAKWVVRLGPLEWSRYTRASRTTESLQLLGSVQRAAQIGALAVDTNGDYFQVNGEYVTPLNKRLIAKAVSAASGRPPRLREPHKRQSAAPPVVTVRRKRVPVSSTLRIQATGDD